MNKNILWILILIIVIGLGVVLLDMEEPPVNDTDSNETATSSEQIRNETEVPQDWQAYENDGFNFTFLYPESAQTRVENKMAKVQLIGPDAEENTELTDGFTLFVHTQESEAPLSELAQEQFAQDTELQESVEEPHQVTVGDREGYEYRIQTGLGSIATHVILPTEGAEYFIVSYTVSGTDEAREEYQEIVDGIISTLTIR